jgi:chorismate dehydratase
VGDWKIVPEICIASNGRSGNMALFFKEDISRLHTVAVQSHALTANILLQIILREKFESEPTLDKLDIDNRTDLAGYDAVLLVGDQALQHRQKNPHFLDLSEEWHDLTGLPFVHAFWAGHEMALNENDVQKLIDAFTLSKNQKNQWISNYCKNNELNEKRAKNHLQNDIYYTFGKNEMSGLKEFFRYAFFFGMIEHIPDLHFI